MKTLLFLFTALALAPGIRAVDAPFVSAGLDNGDPEKGVQFLVEWSCDAGINEPYVTSYRAKIPRNALARAIDGKVGHFRHVYGLAIDNSYQECGAGIASFVFKFVGIDAGGEHKDMRCVLLLSEHRLALGECREPKRVEPSSSTGVWGGVR